MTPETQPLPHSTLAPAKETAAEMSFEAAMRRAIDDLFVCQAIGEKVQQIPANDVLPALLEAWKQGLANRLQTEAQSMVGNVAAILNLLRGDEEAISMMEPLEWQQAERWYAPFPVATVCREDLRGLLPDEAIVALSDTEMSQIAARMADTVYNSTDFRRSLAIATRSVLDDKQEQPDQPPEPKSTDTPAEDQPQ